MMSCNFFFQDWSPEKRCWNSKRLPSSLDSVFWISRPQNRLQPQAGIRFYCINITGACFLVIKHWNWPWILKVFKGSTRNGYRLTNFSLGLVSSNGVNLSSNQPVVNWQAIRVSTTSLQLVNYWHCLPKIRKNSWNSEAVCILPGN